MDNRMRLLLLAVLFSVVTGAGPAFGAGPRILQLDYTLGSGYRVDDLDWNIAGFLTPADFVDVLSELSWNDLEIFQLKGEVKTAFGRPDQPLAIYLRGALDYGWILDGENQDSDFAGNNRTEEFSRSNNNADDGDVFDASFGGGWRVQSPDKKWTVAPLVGFSYHEQNLTLTEGVQTVSVPVVIGDSILVPPAPGPFPGLDSSYEAKWYGPWLGVDLSWQPLERFTLVGSFEYHFWVQYEAVARWNLRTQGQLALDQPRSFEHEADDGEGITLSLAGIYDLNSRFSVHLDLTYLDWQAEDGVDRVFFANGTLGETLLNEVNWESGSVMVGLSYRFF